jgi:hypothetical protein
VNSTLEKQLFTSDGRYFTDLELQTLETYCQSYSTRLQTYQLLQKYASTIVIQALKKMQQTDEAVIQQYGETCQRDIADVLRYIALAILRDDPGIFREQLLLWMQTIMTAFKKESQSAKAYRIVQEIVGAHFPLVNAQLIHPYLNLVVETLTAK